MTSVLDSKQKNVQRCESEIAFATLVVTTGTLWRYVIPNAGVPED